MWGVQMPKYFFNPNQKTNETITLSGETAHHLLHVLRMSPGEALILCDGAETDYAVTIEQTGKKPEILCKINSHYPSLSEPHTKIVLYQGLPKADKLDLIIQKCVELGVSKIIPVATSRSVVRIKGDKKTARYQRIAESAAGQSMRGIIPTVDDAISFEAAVKQLDKTHLTLVAYEAEKTCTLKQALKLCKSKNINIWIGPEGGFAGEEISALTNHGAIPITLGKRILRTETAAIATVAQILCLTED